MLTGNIGEWSEIYTFLKLLADGVLFGADDELNKLDDIYYPVLSILREESNREIAYRRNGGIKVYDAEGNSIITVPERSFKEQASKLLKQIQTDGNSGGSFSSPDLENFLSTISVHKLTADTRSKKDITVIVHDFRTGLKPKLGFSIKSQLGGASTLFNPGSATNFTYRLEKDSFTVNEEVSVYGDSEAVRIRDRVANRIEKGYKFVFEETGNATFTSNLTMIDSQLPKILSYLVLYYYMGRAGTVKELTKILEAENPLGFDAIGHKFYEHKVKNFLMDVALGMTPAKPWEGNYLASGGYIIVRHDGELVCYHIYNIDQFKEYLFKNTKLDTPSTSRYAFGNFFSEEGKTKIKLNLQVRFIK
jgi:hypothetical protein